MLCIFPLLSKEPFLWQEALLPRNYPQVTHIGLDSPDPCARTATNVITRAYDPSVGSPPSPEPRRLHPITSVLFELRILVFGGGGLSHTSLPAATIVLDAGYKAQNDANGEDSRPSVEPFLILIQSSTPQKFSKTTLTMNT